MKKQTVIFDGNRFNTLDTFYDEVTRLLNPADGTNGRNLDALDDLLYGGFGLHEFKEPINVKWLNSKKSRKNLGYFTFKKLVKVFKTNENVSLFELE